MIGIEYRHYKILLDIFKKYPFSFYAFGSRVKNTYQKFSDLDICYMDPIPLKVLGQIRNELEESNLPFRVDLIDYSAADENFQKLIKNDLVQLK